MPPAGNCGHEYDTPGGMGTQRVAEGAARRMLVFQYGRSFTVRPGIERMSQQPEVTTISPEPMAPPIMGPIVADPARLKAADGGTPQNPRIMAMARSGFRAGWSARSCFCAYCFRTDVYRHCGVRGAVVASVLGSESAVCTVSLAVGVCRAWGRCEGVVSGAWGC